MQNLRGPRLLHACASDEGGATLVEFAVVSTLLFSLLFGIVEFGLAFRDRLTVADASQSAVRIGASLGDADDSDFEVLRSLEESLGRLPNSGIGVVKFVDIFKARDDGSPSSGCPGASCNRYVYVPDPLGTCDWVPCPDPGLGPPVYGGSWSPGDRDIALPGLEVMGVRISYAHDWVTGRLIPLPNVDCDGSPGAGCWADTAIMRLEPQQFE